MSVTDARQATGSARPLPPLVGPAIAVPVPGLSPPRRRPARPDSGVACRPPSGIPASHPASRQHQDLHEAIDAADPARIHGAGRGWTELANEIARLGQDLQRAVRAAEPAWRGPAGEHARRTMSAVAGWGTRTGAAVQHMATTVRRQAVAAQEARAAMPAPVHYEPAEHLNRLLGISDPVEWARAGRDLAADHAAHIAARQQAIRVTHTYSRALRETDSALPAFGAPPRQPPPFRPQRTNSRGAGPPAPAPPLPPCGPVPAGGFGPRGSAGGSAGVPDEEVGRSFGPVVTARPGCPDAPPDEASGPCRQGFLIQTEDVWGDGQRVAPSVIGHNPPTVRRE